MVNFKISIAEITVEITAIYESTRDFCRKYLTDSSPDFTVEITDADIEFERERSYSADIKEGRRPKEFSSEYLETLAVYRKIAEKLPFYNAFLFHGSAVAVDGVGYIFTAESGTGKSTHVGFYREKFGNRAVVVNDDKPIILLKDNGAFVCGTAWSGKGELDTNIIVPLKAICVLNRGEENTIEKVEPTAVLGKIIAQSYRPMSPDALQKLLELLSKMSEHTQYYNLHCNKQPEAALVSFNGMQGAVL